MPTIMPDIANHTTAQTEGTLDWVGMSNIEMPIMVASEGQSERMVSAYVDAFVNLKEPKAKGIHMSRLYLLIDDLSNNGVLNYQSLVTVLDGFISSHQDLSDNAKVEFTFDLQKDIHANHKDPKFKAIIDKSYKVNFGKVDL